MCNIKIDLRPVAILDTFPLVERDANRKPAPSTDLDLSAYTPASNPTPVQPVVPLQTPKSSPMRSPKSSSSGARASTIPLLPLYWFLGGCAGGSALGGLVLIIIWLGSADRSNGVSNNPQNSAKSVDAAPVQSVDAASVNEISDKLKRIGRAFHNFNDINRIFAFLRLRDLEVVDPTRNPPPTSLSWRVHLLPYLDHKPLYDSFHLDEAWDSAHNLTLLNKMPEVYRIDSSDATTTRFQVITGPNALFGRPTPPRLGDVVDGPTHTILAIVVGSDRAIAWTKPDELTLDPSQPIASLGSLPDKLIKCVMFDANPLIIRDDIDPASFFALSTPNGKEIVDAETLRRQFKEGGTNALAKQAGTLAASKTNEAGTQAAPSGSPTELLAIMAGRMNKLKEVVLAMHNYHDTFRQLPLSENSANFDSKGKPFLSWRVHLLPFLNQQPLYSQFKMGEPWDSPHNKALIDKMPEVFRDATDTADTVKTRVVTITGPQTLFPSYKGPKIHQIPDGSATTLLIAFCGTDKAVIWTQPEDVTFDPSAPLACLGKLAEPAIFYARVDGAVNVLQTTIPPDLFKAIVTPKGGEIIPTNFDSYRIR